MQAKKTPVAVVDRTQLRVEYFALALVMSLDDRGLDRDSLRLVLKEARGNLDDYNYRALQKDIKEFVLGGRPL